MSSEDIKSSLAAIKLALERYDERFKHLETFNRSQYSCNKFILDKVNTITKDIDQIKNKVNANKPLRASTAGLNPTFQLKEDIPDIITSEGRGLTSSIFHIWIYLMI